VIVTAKDVDKGVEHVYTTNQAGLYDTGPIVPDDQYVVTFAKDGFGTLQRGPMVLHVGRIGMDEKLGVAQMTQQVVVNDEAQLLQTASAELSTTLPQETLQDLPQTGSPGAQGNSGNAPNPGMGGVSANGSMPYSSSLLDGGMQNSPQAFPSATKPFKPITHFNDFGFNLGGPVIKNRVFLFFDWDHAISHGLGGPAFISVPTNAMRNGDFTDLATIYDPTTQVVSGGVVTRQSFASEYGNGNKIPTNLVSSVAQAIQAYYPRPLARTDGDSK
jgi:hypothetical protein